MRTSFAVRAPVVILTFARYVRMVHAKMVANLTRTQRNAAAKGRDTLVQKTRLAAAITAATRPVRAVRTVKAAHANLTAIHPSAKNVTMAPAMTDVRENFRLVIIVMMVVALQTA